MDSAAIAAAGYELGPELGRGGMASVHAAVQTSLRRKVAIKLLRRDPPPEPSAVKRFLAEAHILAELQHRHIVVVHDIVANEQVSFIALEFLPGGTLAERRRQGLSRADAIAVIVAIAEALAYAHERGVVHRDLKPENVMFRADGTPVLTDFGIAWVVGQEQRMTQTGIVVGTPTYLSPEQIEDAGIDCRTDLYSLGVMMFELLTGAPPFSGRETRALLMAHLTKPPPPLPRELVDLQPIVHRLLAKSPGDRFRDARAFLASLRRLLEDAPNLAKELINAPGLTPSERIVMLGFGQHRSEENLPTQALEPTVRTRRRRGYWRGAVAAASALALFATLAWWWPAESPPADNGAPVTGASPTVGGTPPLPPTAALTTPSIAVLPFAQSEGDVGDMALADGLHAEFLTQLGRITGLSVIARASTLAFRGRERDLREIATTLKVGWVLAGTIRRVARRVQLSVQLVDARDGSVLWAESFERELTDVAQIQGAIAEALAQRLNLHLSSAAKRRMSTRLTANAQALELYLRARDLWREGFNPLTGPINIASLERVVEIDPDFAQAWAHLSFWQAAHYWFVDATPQRAAKAQSAAETALRLDPDAYESHWAMGYVQYRVLRDFPLALASFERARQLAPNAPELIEGTALVNRRQGRYAAAVALQEQAAALDPLNASLLRTLGDSYLIIGDFPEQLRIAKLAEARFPNLWWAQFGVALFEQTMTGEVGPLRRRFDQLEQRFQDDSERRVFANRLHRLEGNAQAALVVLDGLSPSTPFYEMGGEAEREVMHAWLQLASGDAATANMAFKQLVSRLDAAREHGTMAHFAVARAAEVRAALAEFEPARRDIMQALEMMPMERDALDARRLRFMAVRVFALIGDIETARKLLAQVIEHPSDLNLGLIRGSPEWSTVWADAEMRGMVEREWRRRRTIAGL